MTRMAARRARTSGKTARAAPKAKRPPPPRRTLRGQVWVESNGRPAMTEPGADLLDQIDACGSLSEAARRLRFSYRRAWMLLDAMNRRWPAPLVRTATGGRRGGGATLTTLGRHVLRTYRDLQLQLEHLLDTAGDPFEPLP
jgi:molybdate transport system regulatory protein